MEILCREFDLEMMKADHMLESAIDLFKVNTLDLELLKNNGYFEEGAENSVFLEEANKLIESISNFFKTLRDKCRELVQKAVDKIRVKMTQRDLNKKLSDFKKLLATGKMASRNEKISVFNSAKYLAAYKKYINVYTTQYKKVYSKEYTSIDNYEKAVSEADKIIEKTRTELRLNSAEAYSIDYELRKAIEYTEKEIKSIESVTKLFNKMMDDAAKEMEELAKKQAKAERISSIKSKTKEVFKSVTVFLSVFTVGISTLICIDNL